MMYMARPEDREAAIIAYKECRFGISYRSSAGPPAFLLRWQFARKLGWAPSIFFVPAEAFIKKTLENDESFSAVVHEFDIWIYD
jgi:hypothetical protein